MEWRDYFHGAWALERRIQDAHGVMSGYLRGAARFTPREADRCALQLDESGRYETEQGAFEARQRYVWRFSPEGPIDLWFADGRFFCRLDFDAGRAAATHLCGEDRYQGAAEILGPDAWRLRWRVTGPRKDYVSTSWCRRNDPA